MDRVHDALLDFAARLDQLESSVADHEATIEELRYAGPAAAVIPEDDFDYYSDDWKSM